MDVAKLTASTHGQASSKGVAHGLRGEAGATVPALPHVQQLESSVGKPDDIVGAVARIREQMHSLQRNLNFSVDDSTGQVVVQVVDGDSGKIVRQIPSEDILRLAERLDEMRSLLFEAQA